MIFETLKTFLNKHIDKFLHFVTCFCIASVFAIIHPWVGVIVALIAGIGKETYDWFTYGKAMGWTKFWSLAFGDLIADGIGIALWVILEVVNA